MIASLTEWVRRDWMCFWFGPPSPREQLALIRIGTALVLVFVLYVNTFDMTSTFHTMTAGANTPGPEGHPPFFPLEVFSWGHTVGWVWTVHTLAIIVSLMLMLGIFPRLMALLCMVFLFGYAKYNPSMVIGLDYLLLTALFYLVLSPSADVLSVYSLPPAVSELPVAGGRPRVWDTEPVGPQYSWGTFPLRLLQLHLSVMYFQSGLRRLGGDWLAGQAFWHPRIQELSPPVAPETLDMFPSMLSFFTYTMLLFELLYPVFIWNRRLRYPAFAVMVLVHLTVGVLWDVLPFAFLMMVLNVSFLPSEGLADLREGLRLALARALGRKI
ncbi:MAG: HTTM domain-containing protein [Deltaproteobacteria bacterium]|nr:HTTM domain-containing protein [Deltaproteobacteria bacterium]